jgi:hypothetical protein
MLDDSLHRATAVERYRDLSREGAQQAMVRMEQSGNVIR